VARHASLRTFFPSDDGSPRQLIAEHASLVIEPAAHLDAAREIVQAPFDLATAPLARARLIKISDTEHILAYALHHTIADGWSNLVFNRELQLLYAGQANLPALPVEYADYAQWERDRFRESTHRQLDYWEKRLAGAPARLNLTTDRPRPAVQTFNSGSCSCTLPPDLTQAIREAYRGGSATLFMKLLAVFKLLLHKISGERDLCVGTPVAHRDHRDVESVMGCFINTLVLRTRLSPDQTFESFLDGIRNATLEAFAHPDAPFEKVVERLRPPRDPGHHPLFQVLFNGLAFEEPTTTAEGTTLQREWLVDPESKFDMTLYVREQKDRIRLHLVYNSDLFDARRMENLLQDYQRLAEACMASPQMLLREFHSVGILPAEKVGRCGPLSRRSIRAKAEHRRPFDRLRAGGAVGPPRPTPAIETALAGIWRDVLGVREVGRDDNFFSLGGHSLLAVQLVSRIRRLFDTTLPLRCVFEHPTVAALARVIDRRQPPSLVPAISEDHHAVSPDQQRLWRIHRLGQDGYYYNVPRAVRLTGQLDRDRLRAALEAVLERHTVLRTVYEGDADQVRVNVLPAARIPFDVVDLSGLPAAERAAQEKALIEKDARHRFDLARHPPLRCTLVRCDELQHTLIVTAHHIAADCWSMGMPFALANAWMPGAFFRQLWDWYRGVPWPYEQHRFDEMARRQHAWLAGDEAARQVACWRELLAGRPKALEIPPDFERPPAWDYHGERLRFGIDPGIANALRALGREHRTTLFVVLQAAFSALLHGLTGEEDFVTGTTVPNRARWDADDLIGPFSNSLPIRANLSGDPSFHEIIRRTHDAAFAAYSCQEVPLLRVAAELQVEAAADRHPLFQVRVLLHVPADKPFEADGLRMSAASVEREVAKYDLTLLMADDGTALEGRLEYATALYRRETAAKIIHHYERLLTAVAANPAMPLSTML
ncbi:MAG TPA: condensation domain-containing protein, partial [Kiritimatiellia bacterium]